MNAARTLNAAIVVATVVGALGFVRAQAEGSPPPPAVRSVEAAPSPNPAAAPVPDRG